MRFPSAHSLTAGLLVAAVFLLQTPTQASAFDWNSFFASLNVSFYTPTPVVIATPQPVIMPSFNFMTPTANSTNQPTSTPTQKPSATSTPSPITTPTTSNTDQQKKDYIMNAINQFRASKGLPAVKTDSYTCNFAKTRSQEITTAFNHDGFSQRVNSKTLPYPSYHEVTENIAMNPDYRNVVQSWINSPGHNANMQKDTPYVCVEFTGNYYAYEGWRP